MRRRFVLAVSEFLAFMLLVSLIGLMSLFGIKAPLISAVMAPL